MEPLQKHAATSKHYAACDVAEIPLFFFHSARYNSASARACEFAILTCSRSKAVREATWDEIDLNKGVWTIPVEHDKIKTEGRDRRIFLSNQAIELLRSLPRYPGSKVLFPNQRGCPLSDAALTMFLRGMHEDRMVTDGRGWIDPMLKKANGNPAIITIHGSARATFRTWAKSDIYENNRRFDQEAVELCLLHAKRDAYKGAYDRAFLERERQLIMSAWGNTVGVCETHARTLNNGPQHPGHDPNKQMLLRKATNTNLEDAKILLSIFLGEFMSIFFIRLPETLQQLAIGKTTLYARIAKGTFPPPVKFGDRVSAWPQHEVDAVIRALLRSASEDDLRALVAHLIRLRSQPNDAGTIAA